MIRFACSVCRTVMEAPKEDTGKKMPCAKCGRQLLVPSPVRAKPKPKPRYRCQMQGELPPKEWAALRLWAANVRDNDQIAPSLRADARSLISLLDRQDDLRSRHKGVADSLWQSALLLAEKMVNSSTQGAKKP